MSRITEFEGSNSRRYTNALHASYHLAQYKVLEQKASLSDRAHVSEELVEKYQKYVNELIDRNKVAQASADTQETTRHNTERGRLVSLLFYLVSNGLMSIDDKIRSAALLLDIVVRPYKGIQDEAHRFAITHHRQLRARSSISSQLDTIAGIGEKRKRALPRREAAVRVGEYADLAVFYDVNGQHNPSLLLE